MFCELGCRRTYREGERDPSMLLGSRASLWDG